MSNINKNKAVELTKLMQVSQAIACELTLDKLLPKLMEILQQNTDAEAVCLLLPQAKNDFSVAICSRNNNIIISPSQPREQLVPATVIDYVVNSQKKVMVDDVSKSEKLMVDDGYIQSVKPLSILSYPLLYQNKIVAIVYLENLKKDSWEFLELLSELMAIALKNAQLYTQVITKVTELTKEETKTEFISKISHDLRSPLNTILGFSQILLNSPTL